jgi:hypothetical protein
MVAAGESFLRRSLEGLLDLGRHVLSAVDEHRPFPRLDDHLVQPEVTRDEIIGGVRVVAVPVELPRATPAEGWARGRAEGRAEGAARSILTVLEVRGLAVSAAQRQEMSCRDLNRLDGWFRRAVLASSADEALAIVPPKTEGDLLEALEDVRVSEETLGAIEGQIGTR